MDPASKPTRRSVRLRAFSLVELLVVIAVLAILMAAVWKGGGALVSSGKVRDTEGLLANLEQAIEAYKGEFSQTRIANADDLFPGGSPPDNLLVFNGGGTTIAGLPIRMGASSAVVPSGTYLHGDVRALVLAMRLRSPKASAILDRIDKRFLVSGRAEGLVYNPGDGTSIPLDYFVDAWGMPIEYYATALNNASSTPREIASAAFIKGNNGEPVLVSYGPDGPEQFSAELIADEGDTSILADFAGDGRINHRLNQDNVYSSDIFVHRMGEE